MLEKAISLARSSRDRRRRETEQIREHEEVLRQEGRMPKCFQCGSEASKIYTREVALGGDDIDGMLRGLEWGESAAFIDHHVCDNLCGRCCRPLCFDCQNKCQVGENCDSGSLLQRGPLCKPCTHECGFTTCLFCETSACGQCSSPCSACGAPTCVSWSCSLAPGQSVCQKCHFRCSKCSRPKSRARAKQCTSCHELRCEECIEGCVDCSLPHCCGLNHCQTCGLKVCTKCSTSHSCALSAGDEETPLMWTDAFERRGAQTTDQLVIDVGEAVIILACAPQFSNELIKCDFYDFRSRQMSTIHLSLYLQIFLEKLFPTDGPISEHHPNLSNSQWSDATASCCFSMVVTKNFLL